MLRNLIDDPGHFSLPCSVEQEGQRGLVLEPNHCRGAGRN